MDKPEFSLSDPSRIKFVRDSIYIWATNNKIELYEIRRAIAMLLREHSEAQTQKALEGRNHL
jgi:hypothetical protein